MTDAGSEPNAMIASKTQRKDAMKQTVSPPTAQKTSARWVKILGSSVLDQAVLSVANFLIGLTLIRYADDTQYGYYVLMFNTVMLLTMLQNSFIGTPLVIKLPKLDEIEKRQWLGSLHKDQSRWLGSGAVILLLLISGLWATGAITTTITALALAAVAAIITSLYREFFRNTLLLYQRPQQVLLADLIYATGLITGGLIATQFPVAATIAILATALSALAGGRLLSYWMRNLIDTRAAPGRLMTIAPIGLWAASGAGVYWLLNQGYSFVTAFTLDVAAVGALAAARLLMMPVNLVCTGIQKQITPAASHWLHTENASATLHKLVKVALAMGAIVIGYALLTWLLRDWIFLDLLRKDHAERDTLLALWTAIFLVKALRDPPMLILVLKQRFRILTFSSLGCALTALTLCFMLTRTLGTTGALWGMLLGELLSLIIIVGYSWHISYAREG